VLDGAILQQPRHVPLPSASAPAGPERERRITEYRYLCDRAARRFLRVGLDRADLEQVAAIGLIKAADRYDARGETPFEAYAWLMIVGELGHHVRDHEHLIRPPRRLRSLERRRSAAWERLSARLRREPRAAELAEAIGTDRSTIAELDRFRARAQTLSLDDRRDGDVSVLLGDDAPLALEDRLALGIGLGSLSALERRIVAGLYWLELSRTELGRRIGLPARTIARIERGALEHLRRVLPVA
jgi:RNA polymerase sigma-B factor